MSFKRVAGIMVVLVVVAVVVCFAPPLGKVAVEEEQQSSTIEATEIIQGFKISSLTYRYTNVVYDSSAKYVGEFEVPMTRRHLGVSYDGVIEIGIDGAKIEVLQEGSAVIVRLPGAEILAHTVVAGSAEVVFDIGGAFNGNQVADCVELFNSRQRDMEETAYDMGLFLQAEDSARTQLAGLLMALPGFSENYTVVFE